jgi:hypothetical protein
MFTHPVERRIHYDDDVEWGRRDEMTWGLIRHLNQGKAYTYMHRYIHTWYIHADIPLPLAFETLHFMGGRERSLETGSQVRSRHGLSTSLPRTEKKGEKKGRKTVVYSFSTLKLGYSPFCAQTPAPSPPCWETDGLCEEVKERLVML